jgi:hypothetical protein
MLNLIKNQILYKRINLLLTKEIIYKNHYKIIFEIKLYK